MELFAESGRNMKQERRIMISRIMTASLLGLLLTLSVTPAHAKNDAVQFGSNINVPENMTIHDAVCFFCSVRAEGTVDGDIVVFFGNVHISGQAHHDVVNFFGSVRVEDGASIDHDLVNFFGSTRLGENASVGHDTVVMFGGLHVAPSGHVGGNRVVQPAWLFFAPLLILILIIVAIVHEVRSYRRKRFLAAYGVPPMPPTVPPRTP
jgi:hypothetical protein